MADAAHLRMLSVMDEVHTIVSSTHDIPAVLEQLLDRLLMYFECDRAWLLYPCDPETPTWSVPMERARPEWPGAFAQSLEIPMVEGVRYVFESAINSPGPVTFDPASDLQVPPEVTAQFGVQSQMILAVYPRTDRPWMLGIHHCATAHVYSEADQQLFASIGRRLGDALSTLITLRDLRISEANLERAVEERTAELERANRELQAFSYSVAHDLRAPVRAAQGFTQLLIDHCGDGLDETAHRFIDRSRVACDRMNELIDALLELSRSTNAELRTGDVDLSAVASEVIAELRAGDESRQVVFEAQGGLSASCDPALIRIVMENLLQNSWKYSAPREKAEIHFGSVVYGGGKAFFVRDNGVGFEAKYTPKLFQAFQRLHKASEFSGTGIGLATVRRIVERHGGRVWAEGAVGQGATFYFSLGMPG